MREEFSPASRRGTRGRMEVAFSCMRWRQTNVRQSTRNTSLNGKKKCRCASRRCLWSCSNGAWTQNGIFTSAGVVLITLIAQLAGAEALGTQAPPPCPVTLGADLASVRKIYPDMILDRDGENGHSSWKNDAGAEIHFKNGRATSFSRNAEEKETIRVLRAIAGQPDLIDVEWMGQAFVINFAWRYKTDEWFTVNSVRVGELGSVRLTWLLDDGVTPRGQRLVLGLPHGISWDMSMDSIPKEMKYDIKSDSWWTFYLGAYLEFDSRGTLKEVVIIGDVSESEQQIYNTMGKWKAETGAVTTGDGALVWFSGDTLCMVRNIRSSDSELYLMRMAFAHR